MSEEERKPDARERDQPRAPLASNAAVVLALQRSAGNQAVASRLARCAKCEGTACEDTDRERDESADAATLAAIRESGRERALQRSVAAPAPEAPTAGRQLTWMRVARNYMDLTGISHRLGKKAGESKWGHWWIELSPDESYGWYPKYTLEEGMGPDDALKGVEGELNGQTCCEGTPTQDYYHRKKADYDFSPIYAGTKTDDELRDQARTFANGYSGEWRWSPLFTYKNCRTFQLEMMDAMELRES
jgi:hypothetical protein